MTPDTLMAATGCTPQHASVWADPISAAMALYSIDSQARQAAFLAQVAHETELFVFLQELWGPTLAQQGYEGRADLGNMQPGDGFKYRGRGLIQVTGRANYAKMGAELGLDLINRPELLQLPGNAALSAAQFWTDHNLNQYADSGDFETLTRRINGGLNGLANREAIWTLAKAALGA
ncbi:MAG TPA: glycoside hydrolase family 19 protein [Gemmatimonadaceae bacterium]|nr:glycoside hydrolase family 19 protein [Gemmatimonadaceae bacterium]